MEPGLLALIGVFTLAAVFALWTFSYRRSLGRRLAEKGFELCDAEAPALESAWRALTGCDGSTELRLDHCRRRGSGRGTLYHFTVRQRPVDTDPDRNPPGASYPAYMFDVHDPAKLSRGAVTIHVLPAGSNVLRRILAGVIGLGESRPSLEVSSHPWSASIVAAHGSIAGNLDDIVPPAVQEKLTRAAAHGFFITHLGNGKAAFAALSNHRDVDLQLTYLAQWV